MALWRAKVPYHKRELAQDREEKGVTTVSNVRITDDDSSNTNYMKDLF